MKADEHSEPVESPWGYHVILREALTDDDLVDILKTDFVDKKRVATLNEIWRDAKVELTGDEKLPSRKGSR